MPVVSEAIRPFANLRAFPFKGAMHPKQAFLERCRNPVIEERIWEEIFNLDHLQKNR